MATGLFIGKFQPFHNGHFHVVKEALKEADGIIIAIAKTSDIKREGNLFSPEQRAEMIDNTLKNNGVNNYKIIQIEDNDNDSEWISSLERNAKFDVVYMSDKNTLGERWVEKCLKDRYPIRKIKSLYGIDATMIREKIRKKEEWKHLVPREVAVYVNRILYLRE